MAAPLVAVAGGAEAAKLASSITSHLFSALGTPLLQSQTITTRTTKRGTKTTTTGFSLPAWAAVAGGIVALLAWHPPELPKVPTVWEFLGIR